MVLHRFHIKMHLNLTTFQPFGYEISKFYINVKLVSTSTFTNKLNKAIYDQQSDIYDQQSEFLVIIKQNYQKQFLHNKESLSLQKNHMQDAK